MWEDEANKQGGRWLISLEKKQRNNELDIYWLDIVSSFYKLPFQKQVLFIKVNNFYLFLDFVLDW